MTQAMNLANFANSLDSSGGVPPTQLNAPVPISKGGTNASTASTARASLSVPSNTGDTATGTWPISVSGNAAGSAGSLATVNFSIVESGGNLLIQYLGTTIVTISSAGAIVAGGSVSGS